MKGLSLTGWRWLALVSTITGIVFNYQWASGRLLSRITQQYQSLFVPADYAFGIWSLIYLSVIIYLVYSLSPGQRNVALHNGISKLLITLSFWGMAWIAAYTQLKLATSVLCITVMLGVALLLLKSSQVAITQKNQPARLIIPFSLYSAWLTVATISNISLWLKSVNGLHAFEDETVWAVIMLVLASVLAVIVSLKYRSIVFAIVIAWATFAIWIKQQNNATTVAYMALLVSLMVLLFILLYLLRLRLLRDK